MSTPIKISHTAGEFHPLSLVRMIWNHKLMIVLVSAVLSAVAVFIIKRLPNVYRADAIILVDSQTIPEKYVSSTVQVNLQDNLNSISHQVLSSSRLQAIIDELGLYQNERANHTPEEILDLIRNRDLSITVERGFSSGRSGAFRISYEGPDRDVVAEVVNRIANLFISENVHNREERAAGTSEFIESQLKQAKLILDQQETALSQYKMRFNGDLPQQEGALMGNLNRLQMELQANQEGINRAQQNKLLLESTLQLAESTATATMRALEAASEKPSATPKEKESVRAVAAPVVAPKPSDAVRAELNAARTRYTDGHPAVRRLEAELNRLLAIEAASVPKREENPEQKSAAPPDPVVPAGQNPAAAGLAAELNRERERITSTKTQLELVNREMASRTEQEKVIERNISEYQSRVEQIPIREQQMAALTRDYEASKANYRSLLDKKLSAEIASAMEREQRSERFTVADPARVPDKEIRPKRALLTGVAAGLAFLLALVLALAIEFKKGAVLGEWEIPSGVPVIGRISHMRSPAATVRMAGMNIAIPLAIFVSHAVVSTLAKGAF